MARATASGSTHSICSKRVSTKSLICTAATVICCYKALATTCSRWGGLAASSCCVNSASMKTGGLCKVRHESSAWGPQGCADLHEASVSRLAFTCHCRLSRIVRHRRLSALNRAMLVRMQFVRDSCMQGQQRRVSDGALPQLARARQGSSSAVVPGGKHGRAPIKRSSSSGSVRESTGQARCAPDPGGAGLLTSRNLHCMDLQSPQQAVAEQGMLGCLHASRL